MKKFFIGVVASSVLLMPFACNQVHAQQETEIKVELKNYINNKSELSFSFSGNYSVTENSIQPINGNLYKLAVENGVLVLYEGVKKINTFGSDITFVPNEYSDANIMTIGDKKYMGTMKFTIESGKYIRPINTLKMEDYLKGVLPYEMSETWGSNGGIEALKAQAIAARTFATRYASSVMTDTTSHQVYGGYTNLPNVNKAIEETKDLVAKYKGNLIETYFSSTNGGKVLSNVNSWGGTAIPYLVMKDDPYDARSGNKNLNWSFSIAKKQIDVSKYDLAKPDTWWDNVKELPTDIGELTNVKNWLVSNKFIDGKYDIKITSIPSIWFDTNIQEGKRIDGRVQLEYILKDKTNNTYVMENGKLKIHTLFIDRRAYDIRFMFGTSIMNSPQVKKVNDQGTGFEIVGAGWGHGIGMSQYGAYQMAKEGKSFQDIVDFYYPNVQLIDEVEPEIKGEYLEWDNKIIKLSYDLNEAVTVKIELIDALTKVGLTVLEQKQSKGNKSFTYDANNLSGKYMMSLTATDTQMNRSTKVFNDVLNFEKVPSTPLEDFNLPIHLTERATLYAEPNLQATTFGSINEQKVNTIQKSGDFYLIHTYLGPKWIKPTNPIIGDLIASGKEMILDKRIDLHTIPFEGYKTGGTVSPQTVSVVEHWGTTSWYKIKTWEGHRWIRVENPVFVDPIITYNKKITLIERTPIFPGYDIREGNYGTVSPQTVEALRKQGNSIEIATWLGPMWVHSNNFIEGAIIPSSDKIYITQRKNLYASPSVHTFTGATVSPQMLNVVEKITNSKWVKIKSYIGDVWLEI